MKIQFYLTSKYYKQVIVVGENLAASIEIGNSAGASVSESITQYGEKYCSAFSNEIYFICAKYSVKI